MGQGQSALQALSPDEDTRVREYSVYVALMLTLSQNGASSSRGVDALTAEDIIRMMQAGRPLAQPHAITEGSADELGGNMPVAAPLDTEYAKTPEACGKSTMLSTPPVVECAAVRIQRVVRGHLTRRGVSGKRRRWRGNDSNRQEILFSSERDKLRNRLVEHPGRLRVRTADAIMTRSNAIYDAIGKQWDA